MSKILRIISFVYPFLQLLVLGVLISSSTDLMAMSQKEDPKFVPVLLDSVPKDNNSVDILESPTQEVSHSNMDYLVASENPYLKNQNFKTFMQQAVSQEKPYLIARISGKSDEQSQRKFYYFDALQLRSLWKDQKTFLNPVDNKEVSDSNFSVWAYFGPKGPAKIYRLTGSGIGARTFLPEFFLQDSGSQSFNELCESLEDGTGKKFQELIELHPKDPLNFFEYSLRTSFTDWEAQILLNTFLGYPKRLKQLIEYIDTHQKGDYKSFLNLSVVKSVFVNVETLKYLIQQPEIPDSFICAAWDLLLKDIQHLEGLEDKKALFSSDVKRLWEKRNEIKEFKNFSLKVRPDMILPVTGVARMEPEKAFVPLTVPALKAPEATEVRKESDKVAQGWLSRVPGYQWILGSYRNFVERFVKPTF